MLTIGGVSIGGENPCRFVAEISNNHNGSLNRALRLIDVAKEAGADFVKFQCYTPDELVALRGDGPAPEPWGSQGWTMRTLYEKAQTPLDWFPRLFQHARDIGIVPFSSVFGPTSLRVLEDVDCPAYKIARLDNQCAPLRDFTAATRKPLLVSRDRAPQVWGPEWNLYCPPGYPTPAETVSLPWDFVGNWQGERGQNWLGLSSHCLDARLPVAAVARGCKLIEMHFQLDDEPSELEADVSLTATEFSEMIEDVRATEAMLA